MGLYFFFRKTRGGAIRVGSEAHRRLHINPMDLGPSDHHLNTCFNRDLSDIICSRFNRAFGSSWGDKWMHQDASMKIGQAENQGSWDRGPRKSLDHGRPFFFTKSEGLRFLHDSPINTDVLPLCN